jgi:uncharacterized protein YecA (UPF0149 family)
MLPLNSLRQIHDFFTDKSEYRDELGQAILYFFKLDKIDDIADLELTQIQEGIFNEWLLYDFKLSNGNNLIMEYREINERQIEPSLLRIYDNIIDTQHFGLFEVVSVFLDEGLTMRDLKSGKTYEIKEKSATHDLQVGNLFFNRIAMINDHWELIGADNVVIPAKQLTENFREIFLNDPRKISTMDAYAFANSNQGERDLKTKEIDPKLARFRLTELLAENGLDKLVSVEQIINWCYKATEPSAGTEITSLIFGLGTDKINRASVNKLIRTINDVYNSSPQKNLGDKSPQEKTLENPAQAPELILDINALGGEKCWDLHKKVQQQMRNGKYVAALSTWQEVFGSLKKEFAVTPEIYRLFANKAVCHFACGEDNEGKKMLDLALTLNPNYDFAQMQLKNIGTENWNNEMLRGRLRAMQERMTDPEYSLIKWNPDNLEKYTTEELFKMFSNFGISLNESSFYALTDRYSSVDELADEEFYPNYKGLEEDEDFVWAATSVLWKRLSPNSLYFEKLRDEIEKLDELVFERDDSDEDISQQIAVLKEYTKKEAENTINTWKNKFSYEYNIDINTLVTAAVELLFSPLKPNILALVDAFYKSTEDKNFLIPLLCEKAIAGENYSPLLEEITAHTPDNADVFINISQAFKRCEKVAQAEQCLLRAMTVAEKSATREKFHDSNSLEKLSTVLEHLEDLYNEQGRNNERKEIVKKRNDIESKLEECNKIESENSTEELENIIKNNIENRLKEDNAVKYFDYISRFGINFATEQPTTSTITYSGKRIGRNDACPCGSGKKYKKCHGKGNNG